MAMWRVRSSPLEHLQEDWRQKRGFKHFSIIRKLDGHPFPAGKRF